MNITIETKKRLIYGFFIGTFTLLFICLSAFITPFYWKVTSTNKWIYPTFHSNNLVQFFIFLAISYIILIITNLMLIEYNNLIKRSSYFNILTNFFTTIIIFLSFYYGYKTFFIQHIYSMNYFYKNFIFLFFILFSILLLIIKNYLLEKKITKRYFYSLVSEIKIILFQCLFVYLIFYYGWITIFVLFLIVWSTDIGAWFIGIRFGKHKINKLISPKKSYEGGICGILFAMLTTTILITIIHFAVNSGFRIYFPFLLSSNVSLYYLILLVIPLSIFAQYEDFYFSFFKRKYNQKDYSNIFSYHGGLLDRFDSLIGIVIITGLLFLWTK